MNMIYCDEGTCIYFLEMVIGGGNISFFTWVSFHKSVFPLRYDNLEPNIASTSLTCTRVMVKFSMVFM